MPLDDLPEEERSCGNCAYEDPCADKVAKLSRGYVEMTCVPEDYTMTRDLTVVGSDPCERLARAMWFRVRGLRVSQDPRDRSLSAQLKSAETRYVVVLRPDGAVLRDMDAGSQWPINWDELEEAIVCKPTRWEMFLDTGKLWGAPE